MLADQTLSNFSDLMFRTTFVIYAISLVVALVFYVKVKSVIDAHRQRERVGTITAMLMQGPVVNQSTNWKLVPASGPVWRRL